MEKMTCSMIIGKIEEQEEVGIRNITLIFDCPDDVHSGSIIAKESINDKFYFFRKIGDKSKVEFESIE